MILNHDSSGGVGVEPGLHWYIGEELTIGWKGHVFLADGRTGKAVARWLETELTQHGLEAFAHITAMMRGVYGLFVKDRKKGDWLIRCDDNGYYRIYYDAHDVSTSLLELWARRPQAPSPQALVDFVLHGFVYGGHTFAPHIRRLRGGEILRLTAGQPPRVESRHRVVPQTTDLVAEIEAHFDALAVSLRDRRTSVDLTAGLDTRLIACLLHRRGLAFEAAVSGEPESLDVVLGRRVAELLGVPFFVWRQDLSRLEDELPLVFVAADGQHEMRSFPRDWQHAQQRLARQIEVIVHGGGTSPFKDGDFVQDFPFYGSRRIDFQRLYRLRWRPVRLPAKLLGVQGQAQVVEAEARALSAMQTECQGSTNNESYNRVAVELRGPEVYGRYFSSYINLGLDVAAPLGEWRYLQLAMRLSPWARFMVRWHRRMLDRNCPALAALPTSDGIRGSLRPRHTVFNAVLFVGQALRRMMRKGVQRAFGRSMFERPGSAAWNAPGYLDALRRTAWFRRGHAELIRIGLFAADSHWGWVPDFYVPRVVTIGLLMEWYERLSLPTQQHGR
jgi:hypothetical protein